MKIYTSYFGNLKTLGKENIVPISIARYSPKWFNGYRYTTVAPTGYMLSGACKHDEYLRKYEEILRNLTPQVVVNTLEQISRGKDVALCCYEKPGDFCHRHLLADWLTKNTGFDVTEWMPEEKHEYIQQLSLFD